MANIEDTRIVNMSAEFLPPLFAGRLGWMESFIATLLLLLLRCTAKELRNRPTMLDTQTAAMSLPVHKAATRARARAGWQLLVALFAALSFVLLVSIAATHRHTDAVSSHDCAVCSVVADKIADTPAAPVLVQVLQLQAYFLFLVAASVAAYACPRLLPPACGPPATSVSSLG